MTTASAEREEIIKSLGDKAYRDAFVSAEIDKGLPLQIRALRQSRGWSQREMAERVGTTQETISRLESLSYGKYTITTLKRLASAFDVGLAVRFEPFSRLVDWVANLTPEDMEVPDFDHDPGLMAGAVPAETTTAAYGAGLALGQSPPAPGLFRVVVLPLRERRPTVPSLVSGHTAGYGWAPISGRHTAQLDVRSA